MSTDRSRSDRRVCSQRQFALRDVLDAVAGLENEDDVGRLGANLPAEAAAGQRDKGRVAPGAVVLGIL